MKLFLPKWPLAGLFLLLQLHWSAPVRAQREYFNWYFGDSAGLSFVAPVPQASVLLNGHVAFPQGAAAISDSTGRFQFSSDGYRVWDRTGRLMPGSNVSQVLRNFWTNLRQVMALPVPGSASRYFVFVAQREFYQTEYPVNVRSHLFLPYVVVDMSTRNGLGSIVAHDSLRIPEFALHLQSPMYGLAGNWAAVAHPNERDFWLVGVTSEGQYCSWLITPAGVAPTPVLSNVPRWIGTDGIFKASPDGRTLALLVNANTTPVPRTFGRLELAEFNLTTGVVTNLRELPTRTKGTKVTGGILPARLTGLEFSPDGSRLYADTAGRAVLQYNLLGGSAQAIDASRTAIQAAGSGLAPGGFFRDMKLAPDGKIYLSNGSTLLARIGTPNELGNACQLQLNALDLRRSLAFSTFPLTLNIRKRRPASVGPVSIVVGSGCAGQELPLYFTLNPGIVAAAYEWNFGDPASGAANTSTVAYPTHVYRQGGQYTVTLRITTGSGSQLTATGLVQVYEVPVVELGPDRALCVDAQALSPGPQPAGSTYRWHDGSTSAQLPISTSGLYRVTVTSPAGCVATDEVNITVNECASLPNIITPNGDRQNQFFLLQHLNASQWSITLYSRWGQEVFAQKSYNNSWDAQGQPDGIYYYLLTNTTTGQRLKGWVEVVR